jgi:hypothetical protein
MLLYFSQLAPLGRSDVIKFRVGGIYSMVEEIRNVETGIVWKPHEQTEK